MQCLILFEPIRFLLSNCICLTLRLVVLWLSSLMEQLLPTLSFSFFFLHVSQLPTCRSIITQQGVSLVELIDLIDSNKISSHRVVWLLPASEHSLHSFQCQIVLSFGDCASLLIWKFDRVFTQMCARLITGHSWHF